jgi:hypothetical protein
VKLDWMNGEYIKRMEIGELSSRLSQFLEKYEPDFYRDTFSEKNPDFNAKILRELQTRMKRFDEYIGLTTSLYGDATVRKDLLVNPKMKIETEREALDSLRFALPLIESADYASLDTVKTPLLTAIADAGKKN